MKALGLRLLQTGHRWSLGPAQRRFEHALHACELTQSHILRKLLSSNRHTAYGQAYGFHALSSLRDWQQKVPIVDYDDLRPWVDRAAAGESRVLTAEPVRIFERTSGSTMSNKLIPYTATLLAEFAAATGPWLHNLYTAFPCLQGTTSYWSVSPATRQREHTSGGIPVGFDDDTEYFGPLARFALKRMLAVPTEVTRLDNMETWIAVTARYLVAAGDLGLISVWHPSFFVLLMRHIELHLDALLASVSSRRAAAVRSRLQHLTLGEALWPQLTVVSCWADAIAASAVPALTRYLPHAQIQAKGLLATEGVVSLPLLRDGHTFNVAAITGHFLEFIDLEHPTTRPVLAHALRKDAVYTPVISTGGGFYRYRLGDAVRCTAFHGQVPVLRFEGRTDQVSDVCGEKLSPHLVAVALEAAQRQAGVVLTFGLVAPVAGEPPHYCLYTEGADRVSLTVICAIVETVFCSNSAYCYARALGQLGPLCSVPVVDGSARYLMARTAAGQRAGNIKPTQLDNSLDWRSVFGDVAAAEMGLSS